MNNLSKKIYFHVGLAKTGSTFLQKNFFPYLKNIKYISTHSYRNCIDIINKTNYDSYLISREFDRPLEQEVKKISNVFPQTKIIIVFRKHEKWISSQFKRMSKNGWHWSFEKFYKNDNSGYWKYEDMNYIDKIRNHEGEADMKEVIKAQNYYSEHQQKNPHTPRVMQSLGLPEEDIKLFCSDNLFPFVSENQPYL